ncbi:unnamed protein product [Spirodela intermedia]|uniref:RRM domain-containing protein n=1 Tax=Spirodela intermedia TaxID=51605 RepID=A0A7I8IAT3_SPIIN|nr:unnamed protein product [Spirodela intermedia]CAA6654809.1 unnamed protein product [Spirodela intermedia]
MPLYKLSLHQCSILFLAPCPLRPAAGSLFRCLEEFPERERERGQREYGGEYGAGGGYVDDEGFRRGLAWETQKESLREHFDRYGEILEAVIIFDKATGRSKGYGFVTFKEAEAAKKACEEATPVINGRRANCNLASLGRVASDPHPPHLPPPPPSHSPSKVSISPPLPLWSPEFAAFQPVTPSPPPSLGLVAPKSRVMTPPPLPASAAVPLYYPYAAPPFQHHYHGIPYYVSYGYVKNCPCLTLFFSWST